MSTDKHVLPHPANVPLELARFLVMLSFLLLILEGGAEKSVDNYKRTLGNLCLIHTYNKKCCVFGTGDY